MHERSHCKGHWEWIPKFCAPSCLEIVACLVGAFIQDCKKSDIGGDPVPFTIVGFFSVQCHDFFWIHEAMFAGGRFAESREAEIEIPQWSHVAFSAMLVWKLRDETQLKRHEGGKWGERIFINFHAFSIYCSLFLSFSNVLISSPVAEAIEAAEWANSNILTCALKIAKKGLRIMQTTPQVTANFLQSCDYLVIHLRHGIMSSFCHIL